MLCCAVLCCAVLCCAVLCCALSCCACACVCVCAERDITRVLFHTPQGDARAVVPTTNATFSPVNFTVCTWLRTTDQAGGILAYVAPAGGIEFALYLRPLNATATNPYVMGQANHYAACTRRASTTNTRMLLCVTRRCAVYLF